MVHEFKQTHVDLRLHEEAKPERTEGKHIAHCPICENRLYFMEAGFLCPVCGYSKETVYFDVR